MIGNNRHSDRTFVSEHICIRLALFAVRPCSLSPSLSPSLFLLPFLPSLSRFRQPSSSRPPVSRFRFSPPSFSFNARASVLLLLSESPSSSLSLSRSLFPPPSNPASSSNQRSGQLSRYVHPLVPSLFFSSYLSLCFIPSLFPRAGPRSFFIPLPGWPIVPSLSLPIPLPPPADSLSPMFIYRDRLVCRGVHHTWPRVSVYVQELARGTHQFRPRCISLCGAASFPGSSLLGVHTLVTLCARVRFERV